HFEVRPWKTSFPQARFRPHQAQMSQTRSSRKERNSQISFCRKRKSIQAKRHERSQVLWNPARFLVIHMTERIGPRKIAISMHATGLITIIIVKGKAEHAGPFPS